MNADEILDALNATPVVVGRCIECEEPVVRTVDGAGGGTESCGCCVEGGEAINYTVAEFMADVRREHMSKTIWLPNR